MGSVVSICKDSVDVFENSGTVDTQVKTFFVQDTGKNKSLSDIKETDNHLNREKEHTLGDKLYLPSPITILNKRNSVDSEDYFQKASSFPNKEITINLQFFGKS
jgi:hypothetical protein